MGVAAVGGRRDTRTGMFTAAILCVLTLALLVLFHVGFQASDDAVYLNGRARLDRTLPVCWRKPLDAASHDYDPYSGLCPSAGSERNCGQPHQHRLLPGVPRSQCLVHARTAWRNGCRLRDGATRSAPWIHGGCHVSEPRCPRAVLRVDRLLALGDGPQESGSVKRSGY